MGTFSQGSFSGFRGKVGSMVGSSWKGLEALRSKPARRRDKSSPDQLLQRQAKFSIMTACQHQKRCRRCIGRSGIRRKKGANLAGVCIGES